MRVATECGVGGFEDFIGVTLQNIWTINDVYPPLEANGIETNNFDSGNDTIYGNIAHDIMFGCGRVIGELFLVANCQLFVSLVSHFISIVFFMCFDNIPATRIIRVRLYSW